MMRVQLSKPVFALPAALFLALCQFSCVETSTPPVALDSPALIVGGYGTGVGQFRQMSAAALTDTGAVLVADNQLRRITWIQRVAAPRLAAWSLLHYSPEYGEPALPEEIGRIDAMAVSGDRLFLASPYGILLVQGDSAELIRPESMPDRIYSMALGNQRLYVLGDDLVMVLTQDGKHVSEWKIPGEDSPNARKIACGPDGNLYIVSNRWNQVLVFSPDGREVGRIGRGESGAGGFEGTPRTIGVAPDGSLYVYDNRTRAMKILSDKGLELGSFATVGSGLSQALSVGESLVDREGGTLVLVDPSNYRLQFFDLSGKDQRALSLVRHSPLHPATSEPDHLSLTLGEAPLTQRYLTWRTDARIQGTEVQIVGLKPGQDYRQVDWTTAPALKFSGSGTLVQGNLGDYTAHETVLEGLKSGQRYAYRAGDGGENWSQTNYFEIPPDVSRGIRAVVLGDSRNRMDVWTRIINTSAGLLPAFIINTGDLINNGEDMNDWDMWFHGARDVLGRIPLMPCLGNHERNSPNYYFAFALPRNSNPNLNEQAYSFDYGPAHWVVLNSEYDLEEQAEWLEQELNRTDKPWIFAFFHRPAYAGHPTRGDGNKDIREAWETLLIEHGVDIAWQGHDHYYFRTKPVEDAEVVSQGEGPVYVTTGGSGAPLYPIEPNQYMAVGESVDHYCVVDLTEKNCKVSVFRLDGSLLDEFSLTPRQKKRSR